MKEGGPSSLASYCEVRSHSERLKERSVWFLLIVVWEHEMGMNHVQKFPPKIRIEIPWYHERGLQMSRGRMFLRERLPRPSIHQKLDRFRVL